MDGSVGAGALPTAAPAVLDGGRPGRRSGVGGRSGEGQPGGSDGPVE